MKRAFPLLLVLAVPSGATAQQPVTSVSTARRPLAYVVGALAAQPIADARVLAARARLEVPLGTRTRPWISAGAWDVTGLACSRSGCGDFSTRGTSVGLGVDATPLAAAAPVQPFVGLGLERRLWGSGRHEDNPFVRAGADFRLSRWIAPRLELEFPSFHWGGVPFLLSTGLRVSLPGR